MTRDELHEPDLHELRPDDRDDQAPPLPVASHGGARGRLARLWAGLPDGRRGALRPAPGGRALPAGRPTGVRSQIASVSEPQRRADAPSIDAVAVMATDHPRGRRSGVVDRNVPDE